MSSHSGLEKDAVWPCRETPSGCQCDMVEQVLGCAFLEFDEGCHTQMLPSARMGARQKLAMV